MKTAAKLAHKIKSTLLGDLTGLTDRTLLLSGRQACWHMRQQLTLPQLDAAEFQVYSQYGQDGIIDWLIERAEIAPANQTFIEFGVESYREANTRFLLQNRNWRGLVMDGNPELVRDIQQRDFAWKHQLTAVSSFIDRENINTLLSHAGFSGTVGLLSVDIDGNDYWVWQAIDVINPIFVVCEFNAVFGDLHAISVPYEPHFQRTEAHFSNLYFGASVRALCHLAQIKGYSFLGTNLNANDAFFVRDDYAHKFSGVLRKIVAHPSRARESRDRNGNLSYLTGQSRFEQIAHLPVVEVESGKTLSLGDLSPVYSIDWSDGMSSGQ